MRAKRSGDRAFTLIEVMVALVVGMVGLLGTVAVLHTLLTASQSSSDAMVAMRLATQGMEQFGAAALELGPPIVDELAPRAAETGANWSAPQFLDPSGRCADPGGGAVLTPLCRWRREWRVTNTGPSRPYNISVQVTYNLDRATPKILRLDMERRKSF